MTHNETYMLLVVAMIYLGGSIFTMYQAKKDGMMHLFAFVLLASSICITIIAALLFKGASL